MSIRQNSSERREQIVKMRNSGLTYAQIGTKIGISRERVRQILNNKPMPQNKTHRVDSWLKTSDVARLANIHANTVRRWTNMGILKAYSIGPRGDRRFKRSDINRLFRERIST
ncbi:helix-turn-helix domain-containing protein [Chloroflexota bacterium]